MTKLTVPVAVVPEARGWFLKLRLPGAGAASSSTVTAVVVFALEQPSGQAN